MLDLADGTLIDQLPEFLQFGDIAVSEVDHIDQSGRLGSVGHALGMPVMGSQRLFAKHMLALRDRLHRGFEVEPVGRHIGDRIELAPIEGLVERGEGARNVVALGEALGALGIEIDCSDDVHTIDGAKMRRMAGGHIARAKDHKTHAALPR